MYSEGFFVSTPTSPPAFFHLWGKNVGCVWAWPDDTTCGHLNPETQPQLLHLNLNSIACSSPMLTQRQSFSNTLAGSCGDKQFAEKLLKSSKQDTFCSRYVPSVLHSKYRLLIWGKRGDWLFIPLSIAYTAALLIYQFLEGRLHRIGYGMREWNSSKHLWAEVM